MNCKRHLLAGLFALALTIAAAHAAEPAAPEPKPHHKTLFGQLVEGGWVMIPIALCSVFTFYLVGDGILRTSNKKVTPPDHEAAVKALFRQGDYVGAYNYCKENPSPLTNVLREGIGLLGEGKQVSEDGIQAAISKENSHMQTWISYLSVIGVCTPMIGLVGTTTGMIKAFATLGSSGIGDPSSLSAAIGEVLVATASGLFIAIPAFGAFYFLRNRAASAIHRIQDVVATLFRKMPYEDLAGVHIGDEELYAARPNWMTEAAPQE
ncbi:MAG: MotA/TolQ/ExbB proton channel family protein [Verrucomicrobiota bacterium]